MDPLRNPYTPNAGATPVNVAGRDEQLAAFELLLARLSKGRPAQSMVITGLRGVGKTVLLNAFRMKALEKEWTIVEFEASKHDDLHFRRTIFFKLRETLFELAPPSKWTGKVKRLAQILKSFSVTADIEGHITFGLDIEPLEGKADTNDLTMDLSEAFVALGEAALERETGAVLLIDELQFLSQQQLEALITALHKTVQRNLPVTLVGAGLPQIAKLAGDAKSYSERLFKFVEIGSLSREDAREALINPAREENADFEDSAFETAFAITEGYPFFLQEIGSAVWTQAQSSPFNVADIEEALPKYQNKLDSSFFRVRLDRCTELQKSYLRAMAELGPGPQSAADVAATLGRESKNVAPVRAQLIDLGLLYTPSFGYAAYTVPHFRDFILRAIPQLKIPEKRTKN